MNYRIIKTDLFINNKLYPEGSEIELTKEQTKGIESFLIPVTESSHSEPNEVSPGQVYAEHSRSSEGSQIIVSKNKIKGNKK